jgi:hypothetical protein
MDVSGRLRAPDFLFLRNEFPVRSEQECDCVPEKRGMSWSEKSLLVLPKIHRSFLGFSS